MIAWHPAITGAIALILAMAPACSSQRGSREHPNIVLIIGDDHGYADSGFMGGRVETPNLDRLANEGVVLISRVSGSPPPSSPGPVLSPHPTAKRERARQ